MDATAGLWGTNDVMVRGYHHLFEQLPGQRLRVGVDNTDPSAPVLARVGL